MIARILTDFEKVRARADFIIEKQRQFSPVDIKDVHVEDWTDEQGKPLVTVRGKGRAAD